MNWESVLQELTEAEIIRFEKELGEKWTNRNDRYREEHPAPNKFFNGLMNAAVIGAIIWVPILIYFWRTK